MKTFAPLAILVAIVLIVSAFLLGRAEGIRHAIEDSEIWTLEVYDPDDPYANTRQDGTDQTIYIDLDGNIYSHGMTQC